MEQHAKPAADKGLREDGTPRVRAASAKLPEDHPLIEQREAAKLLKIDLQTLVKWCEPGGTFERVKRGGRWFLYRKVVLYYVEKDRKANEEKHRKAVEVDEKWNATEQARRERGRR